MTKGETIRGKIKTKSYTVMVRGKKNIIMEKKGRGYICTYIQFKIIVEWDQGARNYNLINNPKKK